MGEDKVKTLQELVQEEREGLLAHAFPVPLLGRADRPVPSVRIGPDLLQKSVLILDSLLDNIVLVGELCGVVFLLLHLVFEVLDVVSHVLLDHFAREHLTLEDLQVLVD